MTEKNDRNLAKHAPEKVVLEAPLRKVETQKFGTIFPTNVKENSSNFKSPSEAVFRREQKN